MRREYILAGSGGQGRRPLDAVHAADHADRLAQVQEAPDLVRADHRVGHEDVADPAVRHHLRLAQLGAGDPLGAKVQLHPGEPGDLVRLDVGPQGTAALVRIALILSHVVLHHRQVRDDRRGLDLIELHLKDLHPWVVPCRDGISLRRDARCSA